jgi:hypothetical protein
MEAGVPLWRRAAGGAPSAASWSFITSGPTPSAARPRPRISGCAAAPTTPMRPTCSTSTGRPGRWGLGLDRVRNQVAFCQTSAPPRSVGGRSFRNVVVALAKVDCYRDRRHPPLGLCGRPDRNPWLRRESRNASKEGGQRLEGRGHPAARRGKGARASGTAIGLPGGSGGGARSPRSATADPGPRGQCRSAVGHLAWRLVHQHHPGRLLVRERAGRAMLVALRLALHRRLTNARGYERNQLDLSEGQARRGSTTGVGRRSRPAGEARGRRRGTGLTPPAGRCYVPRHHEPPDPS